MTREDAEDIPLMLVKLCNSVSSLVDYMDERYSPAGASLQN